MQQFKNAVYDVHSYLQPELNRFTEYLAEHLQSDIPLINDIQSFTNNHHGKLLRPIFTILAAKLFNYSGDNHIKLALAIECIHIATLLHDDVIDNSDLRHNQPTIHKIWDNKSAILMGDYLFSKAFQIMTDIKRIDVLEILSYSSSVITQGEMQQLESLHNLQLSLDQYLTIIEAKTAFLYQAATQVGSLVATTNTKDILHAKQLGLNFGIAYQIIDDINDYTSQSAIGKQPGDDFREGKVTIPLILILKDVNTSEYDFINNLLKKLQKTPEDLQKIIDILNKYKAFEKSYELAIDFINKAKSNLSDLSNANETAKQQFDKILNCLIQIG